MFSDISAVFSPSGWYSIGPVANAYTKLGGVTISDADLSQLDGFASLAGAQVKIGGKFTVYSEDGLTLSVAAYRSVWARNNPTDTTSVSVGIGWYSKAPEDVGASR